MLDRGRGDIIGSLLSSSRREPRFSSPNAPVKVSAISRRLQENRQKPVQMLTDTINRRDEEARQSSMVVPGSNIEGGDAHDDHAHGISGDAAGPMGEAEFNRRLERMMSEAPSRATITSGKRDPQKQKDLWAKALKKYGDPEIADNWVARPGTSKHESGLAADLRWASDADKKWYHANAKKYGLYFPMSHEPWHIQFDTGYKGAQPQTRPQAAGQLPRGNSFSGDPNLDFIIEKESSWRPNAQNPHSTAFGLGQLIIANRRAYGKKFGYDPATTDPLQQLHMMREYIKDRYGTTEKAAAFKRKHGWY